MQFNSKYYIFDIDNTLTWYKPSVDPAQFLHGNFLFPILRDMMMERGMSRQESEDGILRVTREVPFWDYSDFVSEFRLPSKEAFDRMRRWHTENIGVHDDTVSLVHALRKAEKTLFVVSNNPYTGCCMKLERCGLADIFGSTVFRRIFSTDKMRGCKGEPGVWQRVVDQIPDDPALICTIGDNSVEDGELPKSCGVGDSIILTRGNPV